ncbi:hypothetical protein BSIN_1070 [Burkholderia singularis]|uniref:Uncharacterized protein n=1 Tax=Burkholderia singularis TaxID=1503053 RepID=A0A238HBU1_9BURK|nr:hypothetical protein BSIN_1070 [Burkholderia singularis]
MARRRSGSVDARRTADRRRAERLMRIAFPFELNDAILTV